ncbi:hypothetical protein A6V39_01675 [Candidatus Mycoplasma haematobovis]|uniref:Uncharacterized protein n=1 Tax=Candidatus Mycoplasma haematobovis TaxID=432608 RepID=A0A1A9QDR8_9MOLU|nr:hypothetical protein [Candidatus Mycoplasma haematobovis]OAL10752.1 hypothetical protein A6V39_01675 [Candidatus Mycoplasma haematobovis]
MNKKIIGGLLGGGVTIILGSFGGIEAKKKMDYDGQVRYFGGLRSQFNDAIPSINEGFKGYHIPKWEDIRVWKKHHERDNKADGKILKTWEEMRDYCYSFITRQKGGWDDCNPSAGWCNVCVIDKSWYQG